MVNFDLNKILKGHTSRYSLVIAVAKRAREISENAAEEGKILIEKPVSLAIEEIAENKYDIVEPEEIRNI